MTKETSTTDLKKYNFKRNKEKAAYALKGILSGIVADEKLTELELTFLDFWLSSQDNLKKDGDAFDLKDMITDICSDNIITHDELQELHLLIDDIIEYRKKNNVGIESKVNEFLGLITGIIADDKIDEKEIYFLSSWIENNPDIYSEWPVYSIAETIKIILEDGIVTNKEKEHLSNCIKDITGIKFNENGVAYGMATDFFNSQKVDIFHENANYCFTGKFLVGTRKTVEAMAVKAGANIKNNVVNDLDFLVIGTLASRDWRFTSHGRKIEHAIKLQKKGKNLSIITENSWLKHI
jgi:hypothetical protein